MAQYNKESKKFIDRNNDLFDAVMVSDKDGNIINSFGSMSNLSLSSGLLEGLQYKVNVGTSNKISGGAVSSVWGVSDTLYPWGTLDTGGTLTVSTTLENGSVSTLDNGKSITVYGLDADFNPIEETIQISGSTGTGTLSFHRINDVYFHANGSGINNTQINIKIGSTIVSRILIGVGRASSAIYTVPAGYSCYILKGTASTNSTGDSSVGMYVRNFGNSFMLGHVFELSGVGGQYMFEFSAPLKINEKSDIDLRVTARQNNTIVTAAYDIILEKN